jgi:small subunit ribosomal protein S6
LRLYETTFITDAQYSESEIETEIKKVEELITSNGGDIVETQRWGIRRLAYEIKHKRQGFYTHFLYHALPNMPPLIENAFKVNERIIRFLTVVSEIDLEARREQAEALAAAAAQITIPPTQSMDRG